MLVIICRKEKWTLLWIYIFITFGRRAGLQW